MSEEFADKLERAVHITYALLYMLGAGESLNQLPERRERPLITVASQSNLLVGDPRRQLIGSSGSL